MSYAVALVVDPHYGVRLRELADRLHAWVAESPMNTPASEAYRASLPPGSDYSIESGITKFTPSGDTAEDWCVGVIIASLDVHHNPYSHDPGYTVLEVYGAAPSGKIVAAFSEYGFSEFRSTDDGFVARKISAVTEIAAGRYRPPVVRSRRRKFQMRI